MDIFNLLFLAALAVAGLSVFVFVVQAVRYGSMYKKTTGTVRLIYQHKDTDNVTKYQAYYVYQDEAGREYEGRSVEHANSSPFREGQQISVLYLNGNPEKSTINLFRERYAWALFLLWFSLFLFVCAILAMLRPN